MEKPKYYDKLTAIIRPMGNHLDEMAAISNWIEVEFTHNSLVNPTVMLENSKKAHKWDELDDKIAKYVYDEGITHVEFEDEDNDEDNGNIIKIGELAASAFGYL